MSSNPYESPQSADRNSTERREPLALRSEADVRRALGAIRRHTLVWEANAIWLAYASHGGKTNVWITSLWILLVCFAFSSIFRLRLLRYVFIGLHVILGVAVCYTTYITTTSAMKDNWAMMALMFIAPILLLWLSVFAGTWLQCFIEVLRTPEVFNEGPRFPKIDWSEFDFEFPRFDIPLPRTRKQWKWTAIGTALLLYLTIYLALKWYVAS